jgi:hypothetical protein
VEEEEEDLFVFNDGRLRLSQGASLKPDESEGFSPRRRRIYSYSMIHGAARRWLQRPVR